jgi:hypothetical protein
MTKAETFTDYWRQFFLVGDFELFSEYLEIMENFIETEQKKYADQSRELKQKRFQQMRKDVEAGKQVDFEFQQIPSEEQYADMQVQFLDQFYDILRKSFFVALYAFFESRLRDECCNRKGKDVLLSFSEIKGSVTEKTEIYWEKVLMFRFPRTSYWGDIHKGYRLLRNCIVHNEGLLNEDFTTGRGDLKKFIDRKEYKPLLSLQGEAIVLHKGFCEKALETIEKFFDSLFASTS